MTANAIVLALHLVMLLTHNFILLLIVTFCIGLNIPLLQQVGYNYMIEFFAKSNQVAAGTAYNMINACVFFLTTLYFWKLSNDWTGYFVIVLAFNAISLIGVILMPDSPRLLLALGKEAEAVTSLE